MKKYVINRDHSEVEFSISYMMVSNVKGLFQNFQGHFSFDQEKEVLQDLYLQIEAGSIFTNNKMRDQHLKKEDFLFVERYPSIIFRTPPGKKFTLKSNGQNSIKKGMSVLTGTLSLRGIERKSHIQVLYLGKGIDTWNKENVFFEFKSSIERKDFSLQWNKTLEQGQLLLGEKVEIFGHVQGQPSGQKTTSSRYLIPDTPGIRLREQYSRGEIDKKLIKPIEIPTKKEKEDKEGKEEKPSSPSTSKEKSVQERPCVRSVTAELKRTISFSVVGLFGFIGAILMSVFMRSLLIDYFKSRMITTESNQERLEKVEDRVGLFSHFFIMGVTFIYIYCFYILAFE